MKNRIERFRSLFEEAERGDDYWIAGPVLQLTEDVFRLMREKGISRAELARRMDVTPAYVTKILRGDTNFTIATMVKLARALGVRLGWPRLIEATASAVAQTAHSNQAGFGNIVTAQLRPVWNSTATGAALLAIRPERQVSH